MVSSAKSNMEQVSRDDSRTRPTAGEDFGNAINSAKDWVSDKWNQFKGWLKGDAKDFVDDALSTVTGKDLDGNLAVLKDGVNGKLEQLDDFVEEKTGKDFAGHLQSLGQSISGGHTVSSGNSAKPLVTYSEWSPAAQHFGMSQDTAYSEHMANTAHQREVADLRAAGLNPVLGAGSGSSGVSGSVAGISSGKKGIDGDALVDVIGATAGLVTTLVSKNPSLGYMVSNVVGKAGDAFDR